MGLINTRRTLLKTSITSPLQLPGCILWYDFSDASTVTIATGISAVVDKSPSGVTLTQAVGASQPTYITGALNGHNVARFNGIAQTLSNTSSTLLRGQSSWSMYIVGKNTATSSQSVMVQISAAATPVSRAVMGFNRVTAGDLFLAARRQDADTIAVLEAPAPYGSNYGIFHGSVDLNSTTGILKTNGVPIISSSSFLTAGVIDNDFGTIAIGNAINGGTNFFTGDIGEILLFSPILSPINEARLLGYLGH